MNSVFLHREKMPVSLGSPPKATTPHVTKSMKGNRAKDTKPEVLLRKALWNRGLKGYRLNFKKAPGRPDVCFTKKKIAIFVNGCFWHQCPYCKLPFPKSNVKFWTNKFKRNKERDRLKIRRLKSLGWKTMTVWECQILRNSTKIVNRIIKYLV